MRLFLISLIYVTSMFAIVDIASIDFLEKEEGFSGSAYGSFQKKRGNTDKDEAEYGGRVEYDTNQTITWLQGVVEHDEVSGVTTDDNAFLHLRHIHQIVNPSWAMEYYFQLKQDKFKNLSKRQVLGLGSRYKISDSPLYGKLFFGLSMMDERVKYNEIDPDEHNYRLSSYLSYKLVVNKTFELSYMGYYQPKFDNGSDYITSSKAEMIIHLTKVFDLSYLVELDYDAQPPYQISATDSRQKLSFIYRFGADDPLSTYASTLLCDTKEASTPAVEEKLEETKKESDSEVWKSGDENLLLLADGSGTYTSKTGVYNEKIRWKKLDETKEEGTHFFVLSFVDEEGRTLRNENYLYNSSTLVGLRNDKLKVFTK